jgi:hypothetical protein
MREALSNIFVITAYWNLRGSIQLGPGLWLIFNGSLFTQNYNIQQRERRWRPVCEWRNFAIMLSLSSNLKEMHERKREGNIRNVPSTFFSHCWW